MNNTQLFKNIAISSENYLELKKCGFAGDSFNDVITQLLRDRKNKNTIVQTDQVSGGIPEWFAQSSTKTGGIESRNG